MNGKSRQIVLASTSKYRRELLEKLGLNFRQLDPEYVEQAIDDELPNEKALRLARGKAAAGANLTQADQAQVVIGSDQVAHCNGRTFSKPGGFASAVDQLSYCSGQWVCFDTAVCLVDEDGQELSSFVERYELKMRPLNPDFIDYYLKLDEPFDCAGSIKTESHGILLMEDAKGQDINTLYGLPLIKLTSELSKLRLLPF